MDKCELVSPIFVEVYPQDSIHISAEIRENRIYDLYLQRFSLSVQSEWIHTYCYAADEVWGEVKEVTPLQEDGDFTFTRHEAVRIMALRRDGRKLNHEEKLALWQSCNWRKQGTATLMYRDKIIRIVETVKKIRKPDDIVLAVMTDTHYTIGGNWKLLVACLREFSQSSLDGIVHLGDFTDGMVPKQATFQYVQSMLSDLEKLKRPFYAVLGNHDANYFQNNSERLSLVEQVSLYQQLTEPYKRETKQPYYTFDLGDRVRCFALFSFNVDEEHRYGFDLAQIDWLRQELSLVPANNKILVFSHIAPLLRLDAWAKKIRGSDELMAVLETHQRQYGNIMAFIHGHTHADYIYREAAFPIVSIGCAKCEDMLVHKPKGFFTPRRQWGTYTEILFDIMVVSPTRNDIYFLRVGAGESRSLSGKLAKEERTAMKKVITYGSFDLFHEGHYRLLQRAKALGDYLIVGVTSEHFDENRGKLNIVDSLMERIHNVEKTGFADEIIIEDHVGQKVEDIQKYHVDIFTLGSDWTGKFDYLQEYCQVVYLERTNGISSTMKRAENYELLRFGVIGCGRIAARLVDESYSVSGVNVEGVYNPHIDSAQKFQREFDLAFATADLAELWQKVNAVYIASPHGTHYEYAKKSLKNGKHVLCEKPLCLKKQEAEELFALAKEKGLLLMEAVKTAYSPGFTRLISMVKSGVIGEVRDVEACFTRITPSNLRELTDTNCGGSFTELGSYTLLPIVKLLGTKFNDIRFESFFAENGLDVYTKVYIKYHNALATSKTGLKIKSDGQLLISGTNGYIRVTPPWWKTTEFEICYEDYTQNEKVFTKYQGVGLRYELSDFVSTINGYRNGGFKLTAEESIAMADIMERYLAWRKKQAQAEK